MSVPPDDIVDANRQLTVAEAAAHFTRAESALNRGDTLTALVHAVLSLAARTEEQTYYLGEISGNTEFIG